MAEPAGAPAVGYAELAALKHLALDGALDRTTKVSCSELASSLDASNQTASRRLQALEDAGYVERELVSDGQMVSVTPDGKGRLRSEYEDYRRVFESDARLTLEGDVTSGMGEGRHYITLSGYMKQFRERLGYEPFAGTLNVVLTDGERAAMGAVEAVPIDGWEDEERTYGPAVCYPATVEAEGRSYEPAHVISPERTHHEDDQLELIAPEKLRDELALADGDTVTIHVEDR